MSGIVGQNTGRGSGLVKSGAVGADSITGSEIADDAIDSEHYTDGSIDNEHIADDAIDSEHYAAASIDNAHLADNAAGTDEIADNAVTLAKMAGLARGKLIYGDASGDPAALAVGSADEVLTHDGTDLAWAAAAGGGLTAASQWRLDTSFTGDAAPIDANLEEVDTDEYGVLGSSMTESSGAFTFPSTGYWLVMFEANWAGTADSIYCEAQINSTPDNSTWGIAVANAGNLSYDSGSTHNVNATCSFIFDVSDTAQVKVRFTTNVANNDLTTLGATAVSYTYMTFMRLADT